ncbi:MerR family transcriptional regulator [Nocardiopsis mangrovi]|uniref:MerR family transcriptional regulator n=1 Tax=Nocardiopsis mangrovi TaxID=1179818 RepID=A0ABV9DUA6_9ACTN
MAWSTRQLAELAGTTVKAVRYYHQIGLLDVPERTANGYKRYEVAHLIRLLQIKRLSDLGIPLSAVASMGRVDEDADAVIRVVDTELEATVARLNRVRAELAAILRHRAPAYFPSVLAPIFRDLSDRERSLLMVCSTVLSEKSIEEFLDLLGEPDDAERKTEQEFEDLPPDADASAIESIASRLVPVALAAREKSPWSQGSTADAPGGTEQGAQTMVEALAQLYNPAQLGVLKRVRALVLEESSGASNDAP